MALVSYWIYYIFLEYITFMRYYEIYSNYFAPYLLILLITRYINLFKAPLRKNRFKKSPPFWGIEKRAQMTNATMLLAFQSLKPIEQFHIHVRF